MIDEAFLSKRQKTENYMTVTTAFWTESQIFLCFAVSPCPALSLLIVTLTIMLCHKTTANGSQALILKNCLESSSAGPGMLWLYSGSSHLADAPVLFSRYITQLSWLHAPIGRGGGHKIYLCLWIPLSLLFCISSTLPFIEKIYFNILVKRKWI